MRNHMPPHLHLFVLPLFLLMSGCSQSPEDKLIELGKCFKASQIIDDPVLAAAAVHELKIVTSGMDGKIAINPALYTMVIAGKVRDELYPAGSSTNTQYVVTKAISWVNSSYCLELRKRAPPPPPSPPPAPKPEMKTVPQVDGNCKDTDEVIRAAGLVPKETQVHGPVDTDASSMGCAYRQDPPAGTVVKAGSVVSYRDWWEGL